MSDPTYNVVHSCLFIHAGSDFDVLNPQFFGKGEGRGGTQIRPLGNGFYGYLARDEEEAAKAIHCARAYLKHAPTKERAIHAFSVHLKPGDVHFGSVWDETLLSETDRQVRVEWAAANEIAPGPERHAAYDALHAKYPRVSGKPKKAFQTEVLSGIGLIEIAANDVSRLERAGKWAPSTGDAQILSDLRTVLALHQQPLENTKAAAQANFDRWFSDSVVVDAAGAPRLMFHGTTSDVCAFDRAKIQLHDNEAGFFFTPQPRRAEPYASGDGGNVMPVYLNIQNPFRIDPMQWMDGQYQNDDGETVPIPSVQQMIAKGYDGVIIDGDGTSASDLDWEFGDDVFIAFYPHQIKSAIGNTGLFDRNNADVTDAIISAQEARHFLAGLEQKKAVPHA